MDNIKIENISIYSIFVFFLIISSNYLGALFPCRIQKLLNTNVYLKHIFGFLTLSFFVVLTDPLKKYNFINIFYESALLYIIFIIFINNDYNFFIFGLMIVGLIYILNLKKIDLTGSITENNLNKDNEKNKQLLEMITKINTFLFILFMIVIIIGFIIYMGEKKIEYKDKFSYIIFILGQAQCRDKSPKTIYTKALQAAFT
jgi:hypothetical protein